MEETANLALPYILPSQAQKHVTHNEALRMLDAIAQLSVVSRAEAEPPAEPAEGARYIVATGGGGDWEGWDGSVACFADGAWMELRPRAGWRAWVEDEGSLCVFGDSGWEGVGTGGGTVGGEPRFEAVGILTEPDSTDRLAVKSDAVLFSHDDQTPGTGDMRVKINKAAAGGTASLVFQSGFSGRAEFGLAGDDDWHVKVSADGDTWREAIIVDRATGAVSLPNTPGSGRPLLTAPRTYHVDGSAGDDGNDGLSAGAGAFATIQKAVDTAASLDLGIHNVTIEVAAGAYGEPVVLKSLVGAGAVILVGDEGTPGNVVISLEAGSCIAPASAIVGTYRVRGFRLATAGSAGSGVALKAIGAGCAVYFRNLEFGAAGGAHVSAERMGLAEAEGNYAIIGSADRHWWAANQGIVSVVSRTITLLGTPAFGNSASQAFAYANVAGLITCAGNTFSGSATGKRYRVIENSTVRSSGATLPGSVGGDMADAGVYT